MTLKGGILSVLVCRSLLQLWGHCIPLWIHSAAMLRAHVWTLRDKQLLSAHCCECAGTAVSKKCSPAPVERRGSCRTRNYTNDCAVANMINVLKKKQSGLQYKLTWLEVGMSINQSLLIPEISLNFTGIIFP